MYSRLSVAPDIMLGPQKYGGKSALQLISLMCGYTT